MQQRTEDLSGDYEYDLAHEARAPQGAEGAGSRAEDSGPAPARRQVEPDGDMSYDEAHDF